MCYLGILLHRYFVIDYYFELAIGWFGVLVGLRVGRLDLSCALVFLCYAELRVFRLGYCWEYCVWYSVGVCWIVLCFPCGFGMSDLDGYSLALRVMLVVLRVWV